MRQFHSRKFSKSSGFTLIEIIVATAIFVTVITVVLALFNYVLQINRRVQAIRQVVQGSRAFTEILAREIRNGRIDYSQTTGNCNVANYAKFVNQSLAIISADGTQSCIYLVDGASEGYSGYGHLYIERRNQGGVVSQELVNPPNFSVDPKTFRFMVRPTTNPFASPAPGIQPTVSIMAQFIIFPGQPDEQVIPYQTSISSDVYNIPSL